MSEKMSAEYGAASQDGQRRQAGNDIAGRPSRSFRVLFWIFAIVVPILAVLGESGGHLMAMIWRDPMPSLFHFFMLLGVPAGFIFGDLFIHHSFLGPHKHQAKAALFAAGYALLISVIYLVVYLPMMPVAVLAIMLAGLGVLGLTPLWCTIGGIGLLRWLYAWREFHGLTLSRAVSYTVLGCLFGGFVFGGLEGHDFMINRGINLTLSQDSGEQRAGLRMLRTLGGEREVLKRCYGISRKDRFLDTEDRKEYQVVYYRLTGKPFNSVARPSFRLSPLRSARSWDQEWEDFWVADSEIGGTSVASRVKGLSLHSSIMDINLESGNDGTAGPAMAYMEWILEFKNDSSVDREARAQITLPRGAVASRLTLWIEGQEREAAFGRRGQVRRAYREVAVRQRRDPALLTTAGPDRVLLQCFPIQARSKMKAKVGITVPLMIFEGKAYLRLPYFCERNFTISPDFEHSIWAECEIGIEAACSKLTSETDRDGRFVVRGNVLEKEIQDPEKSLLWLPAPAEKAYYNGKLGELRAWMTLLESRQGSPEVDSVCLVIDGSAAMAKIMVGIDWADFCQELPFGTQLNVIFAGAEVCRWQDSWVSPEELARRFPAWISEQKFLGGCDQSPALQQAWDLCSEQSGSAILWVHGTLPVELSSAESLKQRFRRRPGSPGSGNPRLFSLQIQPGPNRLEEMLGDVIGFERLPLFKSVPDALRYAAVVMAGSRSERVLGLGTDTGPQLHSRQVVLAGSTHLVRLAVYNHVLALWKSHKPGDTKEAAKLATQTRLVTPVSGAVVLESKQQYARHDLDPGAGEQVPSIPEPASLVLLLVGGLALLRRRGTSMYRR